MQEGGGGFYSFALIDATQIPSDIKIKAKHLPIIEVTVISEVISELLGDVSPVRFFSSHTDRFEMMDWSVGRERGGASLFGILATRRNSREEETSRQR